MQQPIFNSYLSNHRQIRNDSSDRYSDARVTPFDQVRSFNTNMAMTNRGNRCSSTVSQMNDQQLMAMLDNPLRNPLGQKMPNPNHQFKPVNDIYNDESMNIYTEPTIIDIGNNGENSSNQIGSRLLSVPPLPPPPPPPIFTAPVSLATTTTSSALKNPNIIATELNNISTIADSLIQRNSNEFMESQQPTINQDKRTESQLTITGQDLEITVSNGEITQTVLNNALEVNSTQNGILNNPQLYYSSQRVEFLPLCDLLFNIISLAAYFCNVVFDSVTAYTLFLDGKLTWLAVTVTLIFTSAIISQILSYKWHARVHKFQQKTLRLQLEQEELGELDQRTTHLMLNSMEPNWSPSMIIIHICFGGVLWRYFKLFAPVNIATVKQEVRDLCVLRMVHAFSEAAPMLLLQMYLVWKKPSLGQITDLNIISIFLSLFSLCWALSSFSKNIRQNKIHKLILTWLGVIIQFFWRLGTIISRIVALTIYATLYQQWMFAVLFLHWFSMFLWLLSPAINVEGSIESPNLSENDAKPSKKKRIMHDAMLAWVYIFCFINMEDSNSRPRMTVFYSIMFLENVLLLSISVFFDSRSILPSYRNFSLALVLGGFLFGMFFMWLYYRFFHIRHLKHSLGNENFDNTYNSHRSNYPFCQNNQNGSNSNENEIGCNNVPNSVKQNGTLDSKLSPMSKFVNAFSNQCFPRNSFLNSDIKNVGDVRVDRHRHQYHNDHIPGVFNCRLNPALKRKKKKPSTVPPPPRPTQVMAQECQMNPSMPIHQLPLETIGETILTDNGNQLSTNRLNLTENINRFPIQQRRPIQNQITRPHTNASILTRPHNQPSADTFWRKSNLSARSFSISPSALLKTENTFRLPAKHPFSSTITTPTSPINILPTENFTDKLQLMDNGKDNQSALTVKPNIIRPKPIMQHSIDSIEQQLDGLDKKFLTKTTKEFKQNNSVYNYYYHPYNRKMKLRTQTPEILFTPHQHNSRVFYDYPSSVISVQPEVHNTSQIYFNSGEELAGNPFCNEYSNEPNNQEDMIFMQQCQRPPVPGREGGDKSEENENDNSSYVEGKRSILNYGIDRAKLEKILEKKNEELNDSESHKSHLSRTLPSEMLNKSKGKQHSKKKINSNKKKSRLKKKIKLRSTSLQSVGSLDSSNKSTSPHSTSSSVSSGDDGDVESDINQQDRKSNSTYRSQGKKNSSKTLNMYWQVRNDEYDEAFGSADGIDDNMANSSPNNEPDKQNRTAQSSSLVPRIVRGPINQYHQASLFGNNVNTDLRECARNSRFGNQQIGRQRPLYHSAKYKRHNTPL